MLFKCSVALFARGARAVVCLLALRARGEVGDAGDGSGECFVPIRLADLAVASIGNA